MKKNKPVIHDKSEEVKKLALVLENTLASFGITSRVVEINMPKNGVEFCLEMALGVNIKKVEKIDTTIAMALASPTGKVQIQAPIPGRSLVGIVVPSGESKEVRERFGSDNYKIIEKKVEVEKVIHHTWWRNIKIVLGNISALFAEGFAKLANWIWKV